MEQLKSFLPGVFQQNTTPPKRSFQEHQLRPMVYRPPEINDSPEAWQDYHTRLKRDGYTYLPNCPKCCGKGFVHPQIDGKADYQKVIPCDYAGCLVNSKERYMRGDSYLKQIGIMNNQQTFAAFSQELGTETSYSAFYYLAYPGDKPDKRLIPFLLCYGSPGNGKTHLCNALGIVLNENKIGLRLYAVADLLSDLKIAMADNSLDLKMRFLKTIPALILDDYGVNYGSEWELSKIDEIFTARFRDERITVMTTNLDFDSLPERIKSRFKDS